MGTLNGFRRYILLPALDKQLAATVSDMSKMERLIYLEMLSIPSRLPFSFYDLL